MSAQAPTAPAVARATSALSSTIGLKVVMAVTGIALFGFVLGHMAGNLQVYLPRGADGVWALDAYGEWLRELGHGGAIWVARAGLLLAFVLHVGAAWALSRRSWAARPVSYAKWVAKESTYASRTMRWTGPIVLLFVVYHLLHLTWGSAHPDFRTGGVHHNVTTGLAQPLACGVYVVAMLALGLHLFHGVWSLLQTLGLSHPRYERLRRCAAALLAALVVLGNLSIPIAALAGWLPR
ncbi:MAG: succinate dehydrogenase cytochrome b subunit [Planctomycetes bacterium]|nr:succinate dehydrogenase cytochrome b subunit [Planctomycetota bacterium]